MITSLTDLPKEAKIQDAFGINRYEEGLVKFIEKSASPMTIAIQGEWGSGKTSLMNTLQDRLCFSAESSYHGVWLNSWEFSLMKDTPASLMGVLGKLVSSTLQILEADEGTTKKVFTMMGKIVGNVAKEVAIHAADRTVAKSGTALANSISTSSENSVGDLHGTLRQTVAKCVEHSNKKGIIFFIDDLDRIDPPAAVQLLELLKNVFTIEGCVFVLAIDYDVVVKGLEPKFGKLNDQNSREFRSYFDKIIQIPFSMPVNSYGISNFLIESLVELDFLTEADLASENDTEFFSMAATYTVGKNPRSLKRLINTLSLMSCIPSGQEEEETLFDKKISFAVFAIQIAYPSLYSLLVRYPNFVGWSDQLSLEYDLAPIEVNELERISKLEEFNEEWEQFLYRYCRRDDYLKSNALSISSLLNKLRTLIGAEGEVVEDCMLRVSDRTSITQVETQQSQIVAPQYHRSSLLKRFRGKVTEGLRNKVPQLEDGIKNVGARVQANARFKLPNEIWDGHITIHCWTTSQNKIRLVMKTGYWMFNSNSKEEGNKFIENHSLFPEWLDVESRYRSIVDRLGMKLQEPSCRAHWQRGYFMWFEIYHEGETIDELLSDVVIEQTTSYIQALVEESVFRDTLALHRGFNGEEN